MLREVFRRLGEALAVILPSQRPMRGGPATRREQLPGLRQVLLEPGLPGQDTQKTQVTLIRCGCGAVVAY